jgi:hypothetical protein
MVQQSLGKPRAERSQEPLASATRVSKKRSPDGPQVCVRYRVDPARQRRITTLELVVDEAPTL